MNAAATIVSVVILGASLFLAIRSMRGSPPAAGRMIRMAAIWVAIIAVVAILATRLTQ